MKNDQTVSSPTEKLILVDKSDRKIGQITKQDAHQGKGRLHRAFSIFLFNDQKQLLLQKRSLKKPLWPGFWANSCCSHPRVGEELEEAVHRRLEQELNVSTVVHYLYKFEYKASFKDVGTEHELCSVWLGHVREEDIEFNREEISEIKYVPIENMEKELARNSDICTPWLKLEWKTIQSEHLERVLSIIA